MYWQKRFDKENPDKEIEEKIFEIRDEHKDYGYRRILGELRNQGYIINKKKVQRIIRKLGLQVTSYMIIPGLFEPPVRTLRATIPENESHIFR